MAISFDLGPDLELLYAMSITSHMSGMGGIATKQK